MAHTIGTHGLGVLVNLGKLIGSLYLALIIFVVFVLGAVALLFRVPIRKFLKAVREPATIAGPWHAVCPMRLPAVRLQWSPQFHRGGKR